jgi:glycosyltransferase involved in cell wall biosynthesis
MDALPLIAIFCNSFPPERGAAAQRMHHIAMLLHGAGYRVEVVSSMPNYPQGRIFPDYRGSLQRADIIDGIAVQRCWIYPSNSGSTAPRAANLLSQMLSFRRLAFKRILKLRPALVIVSSPPLPMASAAVQFFSKAGVPVLLNISDLWPLSAKALGAASESRVYRLLQSWEHRMYDSAGVITGQSMAILEHVQAQLQTPKPQLLLRNLPAPVSEEIPMQQSAPSDTLRIVYPGLLGHAQGLQALIAAIDWRVLNARLDIYGDGAEKAAIEAWIQANPLQPVRLLTPVSADELRQRFWDYNALLVPLISDIPGAVPSKLFTAIHAGLPVLYSAGGEGAAIVREYKLGLVNAPGDYSGLAASIRALQALSHSDRSTWRAALQTIAAREFNRDEQDQRLLQFIRAFLAGAGNGR